MRSITCRQYVLVAAASVLMAGIAGCARTRTHEANPAELAAIGAFNGQYLKAINDGDIAALSRLTTDDHIMMMPNRASVEGKTANDAINGRAFEQFRFAETWQPLDTRISGDLAYQRGTFTTTATPRAGGESRTIAGKFLRIYRREPDGSWRMVIDMFN
jgi:ketosteroid isomerase-like protein